MRARAQIALSRGATAEHGRPERWGAWGAPGAPHLLRGLAAAGLVLLLSGCAGARVEEGVFVSPKGYRIGLPGDGWQREPDSRADLLLRRGRPASGMLVDATCGGPELGRPLPRVLRHAVFGLTRWRSVERTEEAVAGLPAARAVLRGTAAGAEVAVEAVTARSDRCVYDFLYVAAPEAFEAGRSEFHAWLTTFTVTAP